jgi:hypothetical protein
MDAMPTTVLLALQATSMSASIAPAPRCAVWPPTTTTQALVSRLVREAPSCYRTWSLVRNATQFVQNAPNWPQTAQNARASFGTTITASTSVHLLTTWTRPMPVGSAATTPSSVRYRLSATHSRQKSSAITCMCRSNSTEQST